MEYPQSNSFVGNDPNSQQFWNTTAKNQGRKVHEEIDHSDYSKTPLKLQRNDSFNLKYYDEDIAKSFHKDYENPTKNESSAFPSDISISSKETD